jgi:mercury(II) reductase
MNDVVETCCADPGHGGEGFDLAVVGAGSAGFSAAITGAELGARVALIGHGMIGGTCVNVGCVPSKTLLRAAESLHQAGAAQRFAGVRGAAWLDDWPALVAQKDALVGELRQAKYVDLLPSYNNIAYFDGPARLVPGGVALNGSVLQAPKVVVATGSAPARPAIPGIERIDALDSTAALDLAALPESLLVIGGGYVGCELSQLFARAAVKVTLVCRSRLLPEGEPEIGAALAGYLRDEGMTVVTGASYRAVRQDQDGVVLDLAVEGAERTLRAERLLTATGRRPNTAGLGLEDLGVALTENRGIRVDDYLRSSHPAIYGAGDVTGRDLFVYMAAYGARLAAGNALEGDTRRYDASAMPMVAFTDPQAASVGLTEAEARARGLDPETSILPLTYLPRALAARDTRGLIKLVAERAGGRLLGAHILAPEGGDSIQTAALALKQGMSVRDLADTIFPYLTTVEGLKLAAQAFEKDVAKLSCCAG